MQLLLPLPQFTGEADAPALWTMRNSHIKQPMKDRVSTNLPVCCKTLLDGKKGFGVISQKAIFLYLDFELGLKKVKQTICAEIVAVEI